MGIWVLIEESIAADNEAKGGCKASGGRGGKPTGDHGGKASGGYGGKASGGRGGKHLQGGKSKGVAPSHQDKGKGKGKGGKDSFKGVAPSHQDKGKGAKVVPTAQGSNSSKPAPWVKKAVFSHQNCGFRSYSTQLLSCLWPRVSIFLPSQQHKLSILLSTS